MLRQHSFDSFKEYFYLLLPQNDCHQIRLTSRKRGLKVRYCVHVCMYVCISACFCAKKCFGARRCAEIKGRYAYWLTVRVPQTTIITTITTKNLCTYIPTLKVEHGMWQIRVYFSDVLMSIKANKYFSNKLRQIAAVMPALCARKGGKVGRQEAGHKLARR